MEKMSYHHGTLKEEMIEKGLTLINDEGIKGFSLRKVAAMCGVSHTAPYKHFKNKEELMEVISERVLQSFSECLKQAIEEGKNKKTSMAEVGKAYVKFMLEHKEYFKFIFFSDYKVSVCLKGKHFIYQKGNPFEVFCTGATTYLKNYVQDEQQINYIILSMWSIVHGISTLIINESFEYEGDYEELVGKMLTIGPI
ncbi:TetR/AcrR family transcriptional regulator [Cellulosilyticum sp. I15G10I2]|uniref:TetR/AcrR family transcriptional regulator n=1 Tax=Cellulosilyticum sp. I15G10I2 TaxID=1892843 RepID=UPI00085BFA84|nr:TetR/AcrR family transcriptional regulator [Cellulosilyticum sp. I15G10I2]